MWRPGDLTWCRCGALIRASGTGWYHVGTGRETCEGGEVAAPKPLADVTCPQHPRQPVGDCVICYTSLQVSLYFHELARCIPELCAYPHALQEA